MGKINKYANIYDTEGNLIRHVGDDGKLKNYTIPELEELVDKLAEEKDEEGNVKDPQALNNAYSVLSEQYRKNPQYLFNKMSELQKQRAEGEATMADKTAPEEVEKALKETDSEQLVERETNYEPETYVQFEELPVSDETSKQFEEIPTNEAVAA